MSSVVQPWRYVTPCCETMAWQFRPSLNRYYCRNCQKELAGLYDKKRDRQVKGVAGR